MSRAAALPIFGDAYLADTQHLTLEEHGAYFKLLLIAWRSPHCALPDDDKRIATMLGITAKKWATLRAQVMAFWTLGEHGWEQKRLSRERAWVAEKSLKNRDAAQARHRDHATKSRPAGSKSFGDVSSREDANCDAKTLKTHGTDDANAGADAPPNAGANGHAPPPPPIEVRECSDEHSGARARCEASDIAAAFDAWDAMRGELWPTKRDPQRTPERKKKLGLRLAEHGLLGWLDALGRIRGSPFLRGDTSNFAATLDWVLEPRNLRKILEGNYDDDDRTGNIHALPRRFGDDRSSIAAGAAVLERIRGAGGG